MSKHIETRRKLKGITSKEEFRGILGKCVLTDEDVILMEMHYLHGKDLRCIGDRLGYSESTIKRRHRQIIKKLGAILF